MEKRFLIALVLTFIVLQVYNIYVLAPQKQAERQEASQTIEKPADPEIEKDIISKKPKAAEYEEKIPVLTYEEKNIILETEKVIFNYKLPEGAVNGIILKHFERLDRPEPLNISYNTGVNFSLSLTGDINDKVMFKEKISGRDGVVSSSEINGLSLEKQIKLNGDYTGELILRFTNVSSEDITLQRAVIDEASGIKGGAAVFLGPDLGDPDSDDTSRLNRVQAHYKINNSASKFAPSAGGGFFSKGEEGVKESEKSIDGNLEWAAIKNRFFINGLICDKGFAGLKILSRKDGLYLAVITEAFTLNPGETKQLSARIYTGPKDYKRLKELGGGMETAADFGWFHIPASVLLTVMTWLYKIIPNYGVAILILTVIIKIVLFPLTHKSYVSMKKMQSLQPELKLIREKHKDPKKQQAEIMKLYKERKINPFSGCVPILFQLPIFIAFFRMLENAVELRGQPFILWITDLSKPDTLFYLPEALPLLGGIAFNLLPIVMGVTMVIQQKQSASGINPEQEKMMMIMPLVLIVILYNFPSGLALYWTFSNILTIFQQKLIKK